MGEQDFRAGTGAVGLMWNAFLRKSRARAAARSNESVAASGAPVSAGVLERKTGEQEVAEEAENEWHTTMDGPHPQELSQQVAILVISSCSSALSASSCSNAFLILAPEPGAARAWKIEELGL